MRITTKLMMVRTAFDQNVPRTMDLYKTVKQILNLDADKVILHPSDGGRVLHALRVSIQNVDKQRLHELFMNEKRSKL
jgi:hypothetical protein